MTKSEKFKCEFLVLRLCTFSLVLKICQKVWRTDRQIHRRTHLEEASRINKRSVMIYDQDLGMRKDRICKIKERIGPKYVLIQQLDILVKIKHPIQFPYRSEEFCTPSLNRVNLSKKNFHRYFRGCNKYSLRKHTLKDSHLYCRFQEND